MPFARVRGIDLYYEEHGDGPPLIVAHGLMGSVELSRQFGEDLEAIGARGVRVIAYDARGHGRSGGTAHRPDYRWSSLAADMLGLMHALGLERASLCGGSMGAGTSLMLALAHPEAVERLVLRAPPPFGEEMRYARRLFGGLALMFQLLGPGLTARLLARMPQARDARAATPALDIRAFLGSQRRGTIVPAIRGLLHDEKLPAERFREITAPTLVLTHPGDAVHPESSGRLLYETMPHAQLAAAPGQTYWQEHPDTVTRVIAAFARGEPIAQALPDDVRYSAGTDAPRT